MIRALDSKLGDRTVGVVSSGILFLLGLIALIVLVTIKAKMTSNSRSFGEHQMFTPLITWVCLTGAALVFYSGFYANTPDQPAYATISKTDV